MKKSFRVGKWWGHGEVVKVGGGYDVHIEIPFGNKEAALRCLEGLGKGEKVTARTDEKF